MQSGRKTYPLNPKASQVESQAAFANLNAVPEPIDSLALVTPPAVTRQIVQDALQAGVRRFWMQPGAEDSDAIREAENAGATVVHDGSCLLIILADER